MSKLIRILCIGTCWATLAGGELRAQTPVASADLHFFETKVRPVLSEHCFGCHSTRAKKMRGGLLLDSRSAVHKGGDSGPFLVADQSGKNLLIEAINYRHVDVHMPPRGKLPAKEIAVLEEWIRRGAPFPDTKGETGSKPGVSLAEGRKFWSFQPVARISPPEVRQKDWPQRTIDHFLLAELEKRRLAPSGPALRPRVLIRRASFDLIGLPPTPEEVDDFVNDNTADAYDKLIDRLLAAPQYGERWARFWLDLARYCDVPEPWADVKAQPHIYRDWVVQALNDDVPYDQFVFKQLAADQLPNAEPRDRAALGFLGLSPSYWKELNLDKDMIRTVVAEEWEERIYTVSATFMGLTVACARCHDHKSDPITTQDYYALAGIFASTRPTDVPLLRDAEAGPIRKAREQVKNWQTQLDKLKGAKTPESQKQAEETKASIAQIKKATPNYDAPMAPAVEDSSLFVLANGPFRTKLEYKPGQAQDVAVQIRGNPVNQGAVVPRRFLSVLSPEPPRPFTQGSGRLELARALVKEGAPLTARVIVNRVWKQHFGTGLVETTSDFGAQGERPSHPQLLDDLSARFIANGWSLKWLHREIMLSAAYQQTSSRLPLRGKLSEADPDNRLLGHMNRRRLEVEAWRDAMLAVSGSLNLTRGGPSLNLSDAKNNRRTLYGTIKRRELNDLLRLHDFPDPTTHNANRLPTTTPLQQLFTLNSPFVQQQASALARRLKTEAPQGNEARIRRAYLLLFGRPATAGQVALGTDFLTAGGPAADAAWEQYAQILLASNEFLFVD